MSLANCKYCNTTLIGNFCSNCGQTAYTNEINFKSVVHQVKHSIFHVDKGILYAAKALIILLFVITKMAQ